MTSYASVAEFRDEMAQVPYYSLQTLTISGSPAGGTVTISYEGIATAAIAYNARASVVEAALVAHSLIGAGNVKVKGPAGGPWEVSGQNLVSALALGTNSLTGGTVPTLTQAYTLDALIQKKLNRATQIIDTELGYSFALAAIGDQVVYGDGSDYLVLPTFVSGSVTDVDAPTGYDMPEYIEQDGALVVTRDDVIGPNYRYQTLSSSSYGQIGGWQAGVPYTVSATFGYAAIPEDIKECCLELAVRLWRAKDAGFSDVVGVEGGGAVGYNGKYPAVVKAILEKRKPKSLGIH